MMESTEKITRRNFTWLFEQPLDLKVQILQQHLSICQLVINQILEEEVKHLSGERYSHQKPHEGRYSRYGFNPGSVNIGGRKLKVEVPKVVDNSDGSFQSLESYRELKKLDDMDEAAMQAVLHGLSTRDYQGVIDHLEEGFGLSKSSVSSKFIKASAECLREFEDRDISHHKLLAVFIDGKYLQRQQIIIALGITERGEKVVLGFVQTTTENSIAVSEFFKGLKQRGMQWQQGLLFITDGSRGIKKAIEQEFAQTAIIQRCIWHKRENVLSYLSEDLHPEIKKEYHQALSEKTYNQAKEAMHHLIEKLKRINLQAARSLQEGLEEVLTLHRLGVSEEFRVSFSTTNCIESLNSQLRKYVGRVTNWSTSEQRYRWIAAALMEIETKMRKVHNFKNLKHLKKQIQSHLKISSSPS